MRTLFARWRDSFLKTSWISCLVGSAMGMRLGVEEEEVEREKSDERDG